jgi:cytochrome c-type biogenesis protein CcmF
MGSTVFHYEIGHAGYAFAILAFCLGLAGALAFLLAGKGKKVDPELFKLGKLLGLFQALSVLGVVACLFVIIKNHYFEYGYAWSHSSLHLDPKYMIACFWEGQEGSFLLWAFWNALIWIGLLAFRAQIPPAAGAVLLSVQAVLGSMILGLDLAGLKIGSSPFILLRDQMAGTAPIFALNPEYIPKDGRGLNPLLQNYWNIIHPPTLFLGFALTGVPYALSIAGVLGQDIERKSLRAWLIMATTILGIGIMMGAYWAYETLNFGGYWNWDPVENAVYIPWLVLVASLHTLLLPKAKHSNQTLMHGLTQLAFVLVLYSTFLTRSGILGDTSVHSFTDLGLSGQLLLFLVGFAGLSTFTLIRFKGREERPSTTGFVEWLLIGGITLLVLASFQVLVSTSIPVFNEIAKTFGATSKWAPPSNPIQHYTAWQMGFSVAILLLSALAQVVYRLTAKGLSRNIWQYLGIGIVFIGGYVAITYGLKRWQDYTLFLFGLLAITSNGYLLISRYGDGIRRNAGTLSHLGLAVMLLGILFSAGYDKIVSVNRSGRVYNKSFSTEMTRDNVLMWRGKPMQMDGYEVLYEGPRTELATPFALVDSDSLLKIDEGYKALALGALVYQGKVYAKRGDTVSIRPENTYYKVVCKDTVLKEVFVLYPRAQVNPSMGLLASPDIRTTAGFDLYTHVSSIPSPDDKEEQAELQTVEVVPNKVFFANDFVCKLTNVKSINSIMELPGTKFDAGVEVIIEVQGPSKTYQAHPKYVIKGNEAGRLFSDIKDLGIRFEIVSIDPQRGLFVIGYHATQQDWIILKAVKKPFIALVWGGFLVMIAGFVLALADRQKKSTDNRKRPLRRKRQVA